jgi:D-alanyl-D-alanine carboxypeptidase
MRYLNHAGIKGAIHAKSGSAEGVVNYAGYFKGKDGKNYAFSIFINQAYQSRYSIRREIGVFLDSLI